MTDRQRILETYDLIRGALQAPDRGRRRLDISLDMATLAPYVEDGTLVELVRLAREKRE